MSPQPVLDFDEFAFWNWMAALDHRVAFPGWPYTRTELAACRRPNTSSESAPCRRFLRNLEKITIVPPDQISSDDEGLEAPFEELIFPIFARDIKELHLIRQFYPECGMTALVEAFPNIVRLEAEYIDPFHLAMENWNHANLNPTDLSSALSLVSATLVHLTLTSGLNNWSGTLTSSVPALLISLNSLVSLRHVNTESVWLFGRSHELSD